MAPRNKDLLITRASCLLLLIGSLTVGLSPNSTLMLIGLAVFCLGSGYSLVLRSVLAAVIEPHHRATMFSTVGVLESVSALAARSLLALLYQAGLKLEGVWMGLPFVAAGGILAFGLALLYIVRLPIV